MKQITKSYLEYLGITDVSKEGKVFTKNGERKPSIRALPGKYSAKKGYLEITFGDKGRVLLHQIVYAWFYGEVPYGKELHHKDGNCLNNNIDNLVALTHGEHVKEHKKMNEQKRFEAIEEEKCRLDIPREHYVNKIEQYIAEGKTSNAAQYKRRLKYYDNHVAEYEKLIKLKKDIEIIKYLKREAKKAGNLRQWHQFVGLEKSWMGYSEELREKVMKSILKEPV